MVNIARDGDVLVGDKLITSGYGGIYPKGLPVGNVQSIENDTEGFVKNAVITPKCGLLSFRRGVCPYIIFSKCTTKTRA